MEGQKVQTQKAISLLLPQDVTTAASADVVEVELFTDDAMVTLAIGETSGTTPYTGVTISTSSTGTADEDFTVVAEFETSIASDGGVAAVGVNLSNAKYARATINMTGTDTTTIVPMSIILLGSYAYESETLNSDAIVDPD